VIDFFNICFPMRQLLTYFKNVSRDSVMLQFRSGHCISHGCDKSSSLLIITHHYSFMLQFRGGAGASLQHVYTATETCMFAATWFLYVAILGRSWGLFTTRVYCNCNMHVYCNTTLSCCSHVAVAGRSRSLFTTRVYCNCHLHVYCNTTPSCCNSREELEPLHCMRILQLQHVRILQHDSFMLQFRGGAAASSL